MYKTIYNGSIRVDQFYDLRPFKKYMKEIGAQPCENPIVVDPRGHKYPIVKSWLYPIQPGQKENVRVAYSADYPSQNGTRTIEVTIDGKKQDIGRVEKLLLVAEKTFVPKEQISGCTCPHGHCGSGDEDTVPGFSGWDD